MSPLKHPARMFSLVTTHAGTRLGLSAASWLLLHSAAGAAEEPTAPADAPAATSAPAAEATSTSSDAPAATSAPAEATKSKDFRTGIGFAGLPLANFDSDDGFGYGVKVAMYDYGQNQKPYKMQLSVQFFQTTNRVWYHEVYFDAPNFMGTPWRVDSYLKLDRVLTNNYYGIGNSATIPDMTSYDGLTPEQNERIYKYYGSFQKLEPKLILNLRRNLEGPWKLFNALQVKYTTITPHSKATLEQYAPEVAGAVDDTWMSYLEETKPYGYGGGVVSYLQGGVVFDGRDMEASPNSGIFAEASLRLGYFGGFNADDTADHMPAYAGLNLTSRHYWTLLPRTVFATRIMGDFLFGDVPFFELNNVGGSRDYSVLGGSSSGRGIPSYSYRGKVKLLFSPELRFTPVEVYAGGTQKINVGLVAFSDIGRVWADYASEGSLTDLHITAGGGLRVAWNDNFLIRLDYGVAPLENTTGFYLTFNHAF